MRIGIFGGAFDPVHIRHAEICEGIIGELGLAKLIVAPSFNPPHKNMAEDNFFERVEMLKAALLRNGNEKNSEKIEISLLEYNGKKRNYAYEIVGEIAKKYPKAELFYIIGGDVVREFSTWKNPEKITALATLAVVNRSENNISNALELLKKRLSARIFISKIEKADVSSAHIRTLISLGLDASEYLPNGVEKIIKTAGLYRGFDEYIGLVKGLCSEPLFDHIRRTAVCAVKENEKIGLDYSEVFLSALLHDAAKEIKFIFEGTPTQERNIENAPKQEGNAEKINIDFECESGTPTQEENAEKINIDFSDEKEQTAALKIDGDWLEKRKEKIGAKYYERLKNAEFYAPKDAPLSVLHQFTGAELAEKIGIDDENILRAIRFHTTAKPEMTRLEMLIYTADKIETERDYEGVEGVRRAMKNGLDEGFSECLKVNYKHILNKKITMHGLTQKAAEYYLLKG
jgi:nicotinate-nucleotide adenylyltransferase